METRKMRRLCFTFLLLICMLITYVQPAFADETIETIRIPGGEEKNFPVTANEAECYCESRCGWWLLGTGVTIELRTESLVEENALSLPQFKWTTVFKGKVRDKASGGSMIFPYASWRDSPKVQIKNDGNQPVICKIYQF